MPSEGKPAQGPQIEPAFRPRPLTQAELGNRTRKDETYNNPFNGVIFDGVSIQKVRCETGSQTVAIAGSGNTAGSAVTFTRPFGSKVYVFCSASGYNTAKIDSIAASFTAGTNSGFTPRVFVNAFVGADSVMYEWLAIGY